MPRSPLVELRRVLRASSAADGLLPQFIADHLEEVADALGLDPARLAVLDLEQPEVRGRLRAAVARAESQAAASRLVEADRRRSQRGRSLIAAARWNGSVVELPLPELFAFVSSAGAAVLRFETPEYGVHVSRAVLARARLALGRLPDPTGYLDRSALHLRWRDGRGGLDLRCDPPAPRDELAFVVRFEPRVARPPVLLGQVLQDLGLTA